MFERLSMIIGEKYKDSSQCTYSQQLINPATLEVLGKVPHANAQDIDQVVIEANKGFHAWRDSTLAQRCEVLTRAGDIIENDLSRISRIMTLEQGKPLFESEGEWKRVVETLQWNAQAALDIHNIDYPPRSGSIKQISKPEPVGITLALTAWNFPAILPARKIAPALAAGCSVILKASEETPASAQILVEALFEAGLPPGVLNLIFGDPEFISSNLIKRPQVRKISFTGSVQVGKMLAKQASTGLKRCTFELGGHAPAIIYDDADVETAANSLANFKFRNAGQVCIAPSRFFIEHTVYDEFKESFIEQTKSIKIGDGIDNTVTMGPMTNHRRVKSMAYFKDDALTKGAQMLFEVNDIPKVGYFVSPMVLENLPKDCKVLYEEPFGPIAPLIKFNDRQQMIDEANGVHYGLSAYVFTSSPKVASHTSKNLEVGSVAINSVMPAQPETPFGGVKESGYGYEGGIEAINSFICKKLITGPERFFDVN